VVHKYHSVPALSWIQRPPDHPVFNGFTPFRGLPEKTEISYVMSVVVLAARGAAQNRQPE
jgi:hypothetical protein